MIDYLVDGIAEGIHRVADVLEDASDTLRGWAESLDYWTLAGIGKTAETMVTDPWTEIDKYLRNQGIRTVPSDPLASEPVWPDAQDASQWPKLGPGHGIGTHGVPTWPMPGDEHVPDATGGPPDF